MDYYKTLARQRLRARVDSILQRNQFSNNSCDIVITLYTDQDCAYVVKNNFSVRVRRIRSDLKHDFTVHLYNYDLDLNFTRFGELVDIVRFPAHNEYVEKCECKLYGEYAKTVRIAKCYNANCTHGLSCAMRRKSITDEVLRHTEANLRKIEDEGKPVTHANSQTLHHG